MLTKIVDTEKVKIEIPEQQRALDIDLLRLAKFDHSRKPEQTEAFKVTISNGFYFDSFIFEIQYGRIIKGQFEPIGKPYVTCSEALPYLN